MTFTIGEIGGVVGLISAGLVLIDRYHRGRPVVSLTTKREHDGTKVYLRIKNTTAYDIAVLGYKVTRGWLFSPGNVYFLTDGTSKRAMAAAQSGKPPQFMLKPDEERELMINNTEENNVALEDSLPGRVDFWIQWRRGNATWLRQIPLPVCTDTGAIKLYRLPNAE